MLKRLHMAKKEKRRKRRKIVRKWAYIVGRSVFLRDMFGEVTPKASCVTVDDRIVRMRLEDERAIEAPLEWYPRLRAATPVERNDWRLTLGGRAVMWNRLDFGISAIAMVEGDRPNEPRSQLRKWLLELNRQRRVREKLET